MARDWRCPEAFFCKAAISRSLIIYALFLSKLKRSDFLLKRCNINNTDEKENWQIINDDVMGGVSQSEIIFNDTGTATFQGRISLENNGGFASTRSKSHSYRLGGYIGLHVRIQGDGKDNQLRVRTDNRLDGISHRYRFATQPETWMNIRVPFSEFVPVFRGRILMK